MRVAGAFQETSKKGLNNMRSSRLLTLKLRIHMKRNARYGVNTLSLGENDTTP